MCNVITEDLEKEIIREHMETKRFHIFVALLWITTIVSGIMYRIVETDKELTILSFGSVFAVVFIIAFGIVIIPAILYLLELREDLKEFIKCINTGNNELCQLITDIDSGNWSTINKSIKRIQSEISKSKRYSIYVLCVHVVLNNRLEYIFNNEDKFVDIPNETISDLINIYATSYRKYSIGFDYLRRIIDKFKVLFKRNKQ